MGYVYLAMHAGPAGVQKLLVVKQLRDDLVASPEARSMFLDEARISTRLNHPNIVQTNEVVDEGDDLYLVMEFLDGQPLARILDPTLAGVFPLSTKLRVLVEALQGLHYAHDLADYDGSALNVVHRDVSPHNIIVTYDGHVKLVDFGIAKAADATTVTESGAFKGKVRYSSPEQALCQPVDRRADVFSMGTVLWEILAQRRMWQDQGDAAVLISIASGKIPPIRGIWPDVPRELEAICTKALATEPSQRYATALELREALVAYLRTVTGAPGLGPAMLAAFAKERRDLRTLIEAQVRVIRATSSGKMRAIPDVATEPSGSVSTKKSVHRPLSVDLAARITGRFKSLKATSWIGVVAAVIAVTGGIALVAAPRRDAGPPPAPTGSATVRGSVHLSLRATPPGARFTLDGTTLDGNPYEADVARDAATHHLSVSADGFQSRELDALFSRDVNVDVILAPRETPAPARSASPAVVSTPAQPPPARATILPATPAKRPSRRIDEEDPYSQ
jgi:serine/threonine-protein kinase